MYTRLVYRHPMMMCISNICTYLTFKHGFWLYVILMLIWISYNVFLSLPTFLVALLLLVLCSYHNMTGVSVSLQ